eukprot:scaffold13.g215.t1
MRPSGPAWFAALIALAACIAQCAQAEMASGIVEQPLKLVPPRGKASALAASDAEEMAGYFTVTSTRRLFYWFFQARTAAGQKLSASNVPLLVWLNGGPGCSSLFGAFVEIGPYYIRRVNTSYLETTPNPNNWAQLAHVLFIDSPSSRDKGSTDQWDVATTLVNFLSAFYANRAARPGWATLPTAPLFLAGESYAGHYLPALAAVIRLQRPSWPLRGVAMGNPCTSARATTESYVPFAQRRGLLSAASAKSVAPKLAQDSVLTSEKWARQPWSARGNEYWPRSWYNWKARRSAVSCSNIAWHREPCVEPLCGGETVSNLDAFARQQKAAWGVPANVQDFTTCAADPYTRLIPDTAHSYDALLPPLLDGGVRVLLYSGDLDFICNSEGSVRMLDRLMWNGEKQWAGAAAHRWAYRGRWVGTVKAAGALTMVTFAASGHMVPMDQPAEGLYVMQKWMAGARLA